MREEIGTIFLKNIKRGQINIGVKEKPFSKPNIYYHRKFQSQKYFLKR